MELTTQRFLHNSLIVSPTFTTRGRHPFYYLRRIQKYKYTEDRPIN